MKPTNDLFLLIKSLTKTEKRFFHLFASRHMIGGESMYLKFFDVIVKQKEYDESKIKEIFKKENLGSTLASSKNRLYNLVLKSLSDFHSGMSVESKLRDLMQHIEVLFEKGLYEQGVKVIKKAKKLSVETHKHLYFLELQRWEKRLIGINQYQSDIENRINVIYKDAFVWAGKFQNLLAIEQTYYKVLGFYQMESKVRKKNELIKLKTSVEAVQVREKEEDLDTLQKRDHYTMISSNYRC